MKKYQKGFAPIVILGVVLVALVALYFVYKNFGTSELNLNSSSPSPVVINESAPVPTIPLFPGSKYDKQEHVPPCPDAPLYTYDICDINSFTWEVSANIDDVIEWYAKNKSGSEWELSGGAGSPGSSRYGEYSNGKENYWLTVYKIGPQGPVGIELRGPLNKK